MAKKFYITTPIFYVNDVPHIGHAYTSIVADAIARWHRLLNEDVFFLTGTDEHGQKIEEAAKSAGKNPQEFVDGIVVRFKELCERLNISNNDFIRTTEKRHMDVANKIFRAVYDNGDIYKGVYEGFYCTGCEAYLSEMELIDGKCPIHNKEAELIKEESYFFRLSKYQKDLIEWIEKNPKCILPLSRRNEVLGRLKEELRDLSISRSSFKWGIPLPIDENHVMYVWFDALTNYLSAIDYPHKNFKRYWPADAHLIGKDILWFHAVIWPAMLFSAGIKPPKTIFAHGWWTVEGQKMSKTLGNVVDPFDIVKRYGVDAFRYFLLSSIPFGEDGDFSEKTLIEKNNKELADDLGNLVQRVMILIQKNFNGEIPRQGTLDEKDKELIEKSDIVDELKKLMDSFEINKALNKIWDFIRECNKYINETAPWKEKDKERLGTILYNLVESLRIISILIYPFIPETAEKIAMQLGMKIGSLNDAKFRKTTKGKIGKPEILFKKFEMTEKSEVAKLDLRIGKILDAKQHPNADKLLLLDVDLGKEKRQLVAGIKEHYNLDELKGKKIVVLCNLKPAKIRGVESKGMLLAADDGKKIRIIEADKSLPGDAVYFSGIKQEPEKEITIDDFLKIKLLTKNKNVFYDNKIMKTDKENLFVDISDGAKIR